MKILVIGSGGREHAILWKLSQSPKVSELYVAPGNDGMDELAKRVAIPVENLEDLAEFAKNNEIDLTIVGPEVPLVLGVVDVFEKAGLRCFGPSQKAAQIEGSKAFSKNLMQKYNIPTAQYAVYSQAEEAKAYANTLGYPCVVKADGLAAGKGVIICQDAEEATRAIEDMLIDNAFGDAGARVVIEEFLQGEEVSILAFSDGKTVVPMVSSQDHKRIFDHDKGPNTGGMGAYSPAPIYTEEVSKFTQTDILERTIEAMAKEGATFKGILYAGLMVTDKGVKVLEFNARFGDPETQPVLARLESDLVEIVEAVIDERLDNIDISWKNEASVCVILASKGYPESSSKGDTITGLEKIDDTSVKVFHSGTKRNEAGDFVTNGGRVLGVTAIDEDIEGAISRAYQAVEKISFDGMQYRSDIGARAIARRK